MKINFKNKETLEITSEVCKIIKERMLQANGANKWQIFSDASEEPFLLLNLEEINYIK